MKKFLSAVFAFVLIVSILCGCQKAPSKEAVISKNDGVFQERIDQTGPPQEEVQGENPTSIQCSEQFTSTDGSVHFTIDINKEIAADVNQVIEVAPHRLTEDDIRRVAKVLLGDVDFYERRSSTNPQYSKAQYQQMISRLSAYSNREALTNLMGVSGADTYLEYVQKFIESWTRKYETAPTEDPRIPCDWTLKKERHYNDNEVEIGKRTVADDSDVLYVNAEKNGIEYIYSVITKDDDGYKVNRLNLNLTEGLGLYPVDMAIYRSMLCRTEEPTAEQIDTANIKVQDLLSKMELGQWQISETTVEAKQIDDITEYTIHITAVPNLNGVPAIYGQSAGNLQNAYDATYFMTYAEFILSANGDIVYFNLDSPLEIIDTRNENVATLSVAELMKSCIQHLSFSDADAYGLPTDVREEIENVSEQNLLCQVAISDVEYVLGRVKKPDSDDHYYYIPIMVLNGIVNYIGEKDERCYYTNCHVPSEGIPHLIWINAIDGSIVS